MATDLTVILPDRPGTLADMGEALGKAGVNIDGGCGIPCQGEGVIHILIEDATAARTAVEGVGFEVRDERQVLVLEIEDRPGSFGKIARSIADAGVNINFYYLAANTKLVLDVDDLEKARAAL